MQVNTIRKKILQNSMDFVTDRKLFVKISSDIAEMQI